MYDRHWPFVYPLLFFANELVGTAWYWLTTAGINWALTLRQNSILCYLEVLGSTFGLYLFNAWLMALYWERTKNRSQSGGASSRMTSKKGRSMAIRLLSPCYAVKKSRLSQRNSAQFIATVTIFITECCSLEVTNTQIVSRHRWPLCASIKGYTSSYSALEFDHAFAEFFQWFDNPRGERAPTSALEIGWVMKSEIENTPLFPWRVFLEWGNRFAWEESI